MKLEDQSRGAIADVSVRKEEREENYSRDKRKILKQKDISFQI